MLVNNSKSSRVISDGERRKGPSKFTRIKGWSIITGWGGGGGALQNGEIADLKLFLPPPLFTYSGTHPIEL